MFLWNLGYMKEVVKNQDKKLVVIKFSVKATQENELQQ